MPGTVLSFWDPELSLIQSLLHVTPSLVEERNDNSSDMCHHIGMHWTSVTNSDSEEKGPENTSREGDDKDE